MTERSAPEDRLAGAGREAKTTPSAIPVPILDAWVFANWDRGGGSNDPPDQATRGRSLPGEPTEAICADLPGYAGVQTPYDVERGNVEVMSWMY